MKILTEVIPRPMLTPEQASFITSLARVRRWSVAATIRVAIEELMKINIAEIVIPDAPYGTPKVRIPNIQISKFARYWIDKVCKERGINQADVVRAAVHHLMTK